MCALSCFLHLSKMIEALAPELGRQIAQGVLAVPVPTPCRASASVPRAAASTPQLPFPLFDAESSDSGGEEQEDGDGDQLGSGGDVGLTTAFDVSPATGDAMNSGGRGPPSGGIAPRSLFTAEPCADLDPTAPVVYCCFCGVSSAQARWWVVLMSRGRLGCMVTRPDGDLCFAHGSAVSVHPRQRLEALLADYQQDRVFKLDFDNVAERCVQLAIRMFGQSSVVEDTSLGSEIFVDVAAIPVAGLTGKYMPPKEMKVASVMIPCPPKRIMTEVVLVFPIVGIPEGLFYWIHRIKCGSNLTYRVTHLDDSRIVRDNGQQRARP